ncbi:uncharacterized protein LOC6558585 [Drosophila grimshawi]|uniref:GH17161 n=1 Tax=Drosophila grimshawi TaxID=7222 RepID=B4J175_DROGR|nr:uncharacterized protein LOC6558585 [Drosophila grimshawi]EDV97944.1 GH17161 [Drosophila grimshawi]
MRPYQAACIVVATLLLFAPATIEAKRRKHKGDDSHRAKTKTKWSSSTELGGNSGQVSTEEHGYYVKRTYTPLSGSDGKRQSPPFLAIPIAWFGCEPGQRGCQQVSNSGAINSIAHALSEGYLCDDDCVEGYEPICGQTPSEVAVFYNKCKLNVAKCRTHGLWTDLPYEQCQQTYPKETCYTDKKFKSSPFFRDNSTPTTADAVKSDKADSNSNESSEEQKDQDKSKKKNKTARVEPLVLPVKEQSLETVVPVPVPQAAAVPIENIAVPPLPVKTVESPHSQPAEPQSVLVKAEKTAESLETPKEQDKSISDKDKLKYVVS